MHPPLRLGLIGAGIQRSRTPAMHEQEAAARGWSCRYELLDLDTIPGGAAALPSLVDAAKPMSLRSLQIHTSDSTVRKTTGVGAKSARRWNRSSKYVCARAAAGSP